MIKNKQQKLASIQTKLDTGKIFTNYRNPMSVKSVNIFSPSPSSVCEVVVETLLGLYPSMKIMNKRIKYEFHHTFVCF